MRYRRWAAPTDVTRTVEPLGVVLKAGRWYLVARSGPLIRTYRVGQILQVDVLEDGFERPADFDLAEHWRGYVDDFEARRHRGAALIRLSPAAAEQLPDLLEPALVRAVEQTAEAEASGWVRACIPIETVSHATSELLRLGAGVEVLAPPELRQRLAEIAERLSRIYRAGLPHGESDPPDTRVDISPPERMVPLSAPHGPTGSA
jgi:predicted DNA-binding transcriptional regulator YafY